MKKLFLFLFALFFWTGAWAEKTVWLNPSGFSDNGNWASSNAVFAAFVTNNDDSQSAWIDMTEIETINGATCYKAVIADTYTKLILVRDDSGRSYTDGEGHWTIWNQTQDITLSGIADNTLFTITGWDNDGGKSGYATGVINTYTAKFVTNKNWATTKAYAWSGEGSSATKYLGNWGGTTMPQDGTYSSLGISSKKYSISFKATVAPEKIIFNNGDDPGVEGDTKTSDLTFVDGKTYFLGIEENLAYGATVTWGDDDGHTETINGATPLSNITDGNDGTNVQAMLYSSTPVLSHVLDLGSSKTFNTLLINQTGDRWNTSFQIFVSNDNSSWTEVTTKSTGVTSGRFVATFETQTARYIKYLSSRTKKNVTDDYGAGLAEIQLYNLASVPTLASITLSASNTSPIVGENVTLTAVGNSSIGGIKIGLGTITWNNDNTTAGTITDGIYTAAAAGASNVSATADELTSNIVEITVIAGSKIDLFTNWQYRVYTIGEKTTRNSLVGAFDNNEGSDWSLLNGINTGDSEENRTYDAGFIVDLGAIYDVNEISIKFEGACSQEYSISFAGNNGVFGDAVYNGGTHAYGTNPHTEVLSGQEVSGARFVKFLSTKAATQYGLRIFDFKVIGSKTSDIDNSQTPSITAATITNPTNESLQLNITSSDDSPYVLYLVTGAGSERWFSGKTGILESFTISGLEIGTKYNISIIAYDAVAHGSAVANVSGTTTGGVVDNVAPEMTKAVVAATGATTATLTVCATDNVAGTLTYTVKKGDDVVGSGTGTQGEDASIVISGLTPETTYAAGTFKVTATDESNNTSDAMNVPEIITTAKPMGGEGSYTITSGMNTGKTLNYTYVFTQSGTNVTVTFGYANGEDQDHQGIVGLVDGYTIHDNVELGGLTYTWENCTEGQTLKAQHKWLFAEGDYYTPVYTYVVAGNNAGLVKMPADANGINEILGTGTVSATAFKELTTIEEKAYDLTNLKVTSAVALEANNKNAVFIVKEDQKTNLSGTNNLLVWDEENNRYASDEITITDQPSAYNLFASNLTIYTKDANYVREGVGANMYFTVALPFAGNTPEKFSAYTAGVASANVTFTKVASGEMAKANPYVIHNVNESEADFIVTATDVNAVLDFTETKPDNSCMESVFNIQNTSSLTTDIYALMADPNDAGKVVFHAAKGVTLIPFRAIFSGSSLATARAIFLDGETTKIGAIDVDGKIETGAIYNLAGQRVQNPTKGIYIINGKKVVLK